MTRFSGKIFITYLFVVLLAMIAGDLLLVRFLENLLLTNARQSLQEKWVESSPNLQGLTMTQARSKSLNERLAKLAANTPYRLSLFDLAGNFLADSTGIASPAAAAKDFNQLPEVKQAIELGQSYAFRETHAARGHWLFFAKLTEDAVFRVGISTESIDRLIRRVRFFIWLATGLLILLSWFFYFTLVRRADDALIRFKKMVKGLEQGDFAQRFLVVSDDEVGEIGHSMNTLAQELEGKIRALAEERNRLKTILYTMQEGVIVLNAAGNIVLFNPAMRQLFSLDESALGKPPIEVIRNADLQSVVDQCLRGQQVEKRELRVLREGQERFLMVQATPFSGQAEPLGAIIVMYDITNLRRLERVRRDFVANVSHELKTPLTSIQGYVETLLDAPGNNEQAKSFLGIIDANTKRLGKLVEDLLRLSEIESQQFVLRPESFKAPELFGEIVDLHDALLKKRGMWVEVSVEPENLSLFADRLALTHILNNLVENAIKYGKAGTPILLSCRIEGGSACFEVQDQGIGIAQSHLERIFERFYRVDKSRTRQEGSTGLGLAIVKHLVQLLGGEIEVESQEERGSAFRFRVPLPVLPK